MIDAKGQRTSWNRDVQPRDARDSRGSLRPAEDDGTTDTHYTYDLAGRLKTITDPKDQVTTYTYNTDGSLASTGFTNETIATPDISHTYDTYYPRPLTMVDGNGTTTYTYKAVGTNGAGQLASVDGPFSNDTIVYTYDELGRVLTRMLNSTGTTITYDTLGRVSQLNFPIGDFDYTYVGQTGRVSTVTYPNDQSSTYSYFNDQQDFRLQTIHHKNPSAATLSKFDYTYDDVGNIVTWRQERAGSAAKIYTFAQDSADQLVSAVLTDTNTTPAILKRHAWQYDAAGNRTVDQVDDAVLSSSHDSMNRLGSRAPGGPIVFSGSLSEEGTVTIDGKPAAVDASHNFLGTAVLSGATTTVTLKAKDPSGNETTKQYEVDTSGSTTSYSYDANGNLTADATRSFEWDATNRLVAVTVGTHRSEFTYDGFDRRIRIVEKDSSVTVRDGYLFWDGGTIIEERLSTGEVHRFFGDGEQHNGTARYLLRDHLGSVSGVTDASASVVTSNDYDPYGRLTRIAGSEDSRFGYTGHFSHTPSGLVLPRYRAYDPALGRWLSEDPLGFGGGDSNLFAYVGRQPISRVDPDGLLADVVTDVITIVWDAYCERWTEVLIDIVAAATPGVPAPVLKAARSAAKHATGAAKEKAAKNAKKPPFSKGGPPRDPKTGNYTPHPDAVGPHTTLGTREGRHGKYTQGATFDEKGNFVGRTDVTDHGRPTKHTNPHWHPALGPNQVGAAQPLPK